MPARIFEGNVTNMRFYIATGLENVERAKELSAVLSRNGHELTYDWTAHGDVRSMGKDKMAEVAFSEVRAVRDAELVVALLPGGFGTHTEIGVAIASRSNKRILIWSETGEAFRDPKQSCTFYFHPAVERIVCSFEELIEKLDADRIESMLDKEQN